MSSEVGVDIELTESESPWLFLRPRPMPVWVRKCGTWGGEGNRCGGEALAALRCGGEAAAALRGDASPSWPPPWPSSWIGEFARNRCALVSEGGGELARPVGDVTAARSRTVANDSPLEGGDEGPAAVGLGLPARASSSMACESAAATTVASASAASMAWVSASVHGVSCTSPSKLCSADRGIPCGSVEGHGESATAAAMAVAMEEALAQAMAVRVESSVSASPVSLSTAAASNAPPYNEPETSSTRPRKASWAAAPQGLVTELPGLCGSTRELGAAHCCLVWVGEGVEERGDGGGRADRSAVLCV